MIIVIIFSAIVYVIALLTQISDYADLPEKIIIPIACAGIAWIFAALIISMFTVEYIKDHKNEMVYYTSELSRTNIRTLNDNTNNITGTFALGFGGVESEARFYFYGCSSDSTFYLKSIKSDGVKIIETNSTSPCVVKFETHIDWSRSEISSWLFKFEEKTEFYYIYVPKNTVMVRYNLDAQ